MTPQPDFLRPLGGPHPLAWAACAAALLVLALSAADGAQAWQQRAQALAAPPPAPAAPPPPPPRVDPEAQRALQQAVARLQQPWAGVAQALDALAVPGVAWLALDVGETGALRLEGQAPGRAEALRAAELLRQHAGGRDVVLGRMDAGPGGMQRFQLTMEAAR